MLDFASACEFSRQNCIAICTFLVPANLLATLFTLFLVAANRSPSQVRLVRLIAVSCAIVLALHVSTWLAIGVVRNVTFILFGLATVCLGANLWTAISPNTYRNFLKQLLGKFNQTATLSMNNNQ